MSTSTTTDKFTTRVRVWVCMSPDNAVFCYSAPLLSFHALTKIANSFQLEIQLEWIGRSWYWVGVSWFILEYWISNWNKISLDQLSPIRNSVGFKWIGISWILFFPIVNFTSQYISNWKFYFPTNVQLKPILSSWEKVQPSPIRSKMSWKKSPTESNCVQVVLCQFSILEEVQLENWIGNFVKGRWTVTGHSNDGFHHVSCMK